MAILGPQPVQNIDQILGGWGTLPFWCPLHVPCLSVYFTTWHRISPQILTGKPPVPWFLSLELSLELRKEPAQNLGSISSLCFVSQLSLSACLTSLFSFLSIPVFSEHLELCTELCLSTTDSIPVPVHLLSPLPFPFCPFCTHTRQDERHGVTITWWKKHLHPRPQKKAWQRGQPDGPLWCSFENVLPGAFPGSLLRSLSRL